MFAGAVGDWPEALNHCKILHADAANASGRRRALHVAIDQIIVGRVRLRMVRSRNRKRKAVFAGAQGREIVVREGPVGVIVHAEYLRRHIVHWDPRPHHSLTARFGRDQGRTRQQVLVGSKVTEALIGVAARGDRESEVTFAN